MNKNKIISVLVSGGILFGSMPFTEVINAAETHTVTILDFNENIIQTFTVLDGTSLDLSMINTSDLEQHIDTYTQIGFSEWSDSTDCVTEDMEIYALYVKMAISLDSLPEKKVYYSNKGKINLDGLGISIVSERQTPERDSNGDFIIEREVVDIAQYSSTSPLSLDEAFADGNESKVYVYPINSSKAIGSFDIEYYPDMGDVNLDGRIDASDASEILRAYSMDSVGKPLSLTNTQKKHGDIDRNGSLDAGDASDVLGFYAQASTSFEPDWEVYLSQNNK